MNQINHNKSRFDSDSNNGGSIMKALSVACEGQCSAVEIEQLKERIDSLERELNKRNESLSGIHRNFESVSTISSRLKTTNESLSEEIRTQKQKTDRFVILEAGYTQTIDELRESLNNQKEVIAGLIAEDKQKSKIILDLQKYKQRCADLEKDLAIVISLKKDLETQCTDLSVIVKKAEADRLELKAAKETIATHEAALIDKAAQIKKMNVAANLKSVEVVAMKKQVIKMKTSLEELGDQKEFLCQLESKHLTQLTQQRKQVIELQDNLNKESHEKDCIATQLHMKETLANKTMSQLKESKDSISNMQNEISKVEELRREVKELKDNCQCRRFPRLFIACRDLEKFYLSNQNAGQMEQSGDTQELISWSEGLEEQLNEFESAYDIVLVSEHAKLKNLIGVLARSQSMYKKLFLRLEGTPVDEVVERLRYDIMKLNEILFHYKDLNLSLQDTISKLSASSLQLKDRVAMIKDATHKLPIAAFDAEIKLLKDRIARLEQANAALSIQVKTKGDEIEDLKLDLNAKSNEVSEIQRFTGLCDSVISFNRNCTSIQDILANTNGIAEAILKVSNSQK